MPLQPRWIRAVMVLLAVPNLLTGLWALVAPENWFDNFPGWAPSIVAAYPPFNSHLATDAGAGLFATGVIMLLASAKPTREIVIVASLGFLAFALPHFVFHLFTPADALTASEDATSTISLALAVVGAAVVVMVEVAEGDDVVLVEGDVVLVVNGRKTIVDVVAVSSGASVVEMTLSGSRSAIASG